MSFSSSKWDGTCCPARRFSVVHPRHSPLLTAVFGIWLLDRRRPCLCVVAKCLRAWRLVVILAVYHFVIFCSTTSRLTHIFDHDLECLSNEFRTVYTRGIYQASVRPFASNTTQALRSAVRHGLQRYTGTAESWNYEAEYVKRVDDGRLPQRHETAIILRSFNTLLSVQVRALKLVMSSDQFALTEYNRHRHA